MALEENKRRLLMFAALIVTVLLIWQAPEQEEELAISVPERSTKMPVSSNSKQEKIMDWRAMLTEERVWVEEDDLPDPYMVRLPAPPKPPPPPPTEEEEAAPEAPPLPYKYMGESNREDGSREIFLLRDNKLYIVHPGDILDKDYEVEAIEGNVMKLNYLPLDIKQELAIGGVK